MTNEAGLGGDTAAHSSQRAVFLSYASDDAEIAARISASLRAAGIEVWFDQNALRSGDAWDQKIRREIRDCTLFIPIVSRNTQARTEGYFRLEWHLADQRSHLIAKSRAFLLPVCIDSTRESDAEVPDSFTSVQWTRLPDGTVPTAFVERVARLLAPEDRPAAYRPAPAAAAAGRGEPAHPVARGYRAPAAWLLAAAAAIAIGYFALLRFGPGARAPEPSATPVPAAASGVPAVAVIPEKSIAVLPFADMSERKDQEYLSDGMAEEIIDLLVKVPELHVPARTSSFYFKGRADDISTIARRLAVAHVLEGSVRRSGNRLRVTAQLVRADTGYQLWSETYDRDLKDVFKVQDDIARGVVDKLKLTLLATAIDPAARTTNPQAHSLYLQGRFLLQGESKENLKRAIGFFEQASALDPEFAPAYADRGRAYFRQVANGYTPVHAGIAKVTELANQAMKLDPKLAAPYILVASVKMTSSHDWAGARRAIDEALALDPTNTTVLFTDAFFTRTVGSSEVALAQFRKMLERDPLNLLSRRYVARACYYAGRLDEAEAMLRQVLALEPAFPATHYELGRVLLARGQVAQAMTEFEAERDPGWRAFGLPLGNFAQRRKAEADAGLAALVRAPDGQEFQIAETYAYFGDADQAFRWLDRAIDNDPGIQWLRGDPLLHGLLGDPRYAALLRKLNLPE